MFANRTLARLSPFFFCLCCLQAAFAGEPPVLTRIFPPGGMRGTAVEVQVTGKVFEPSLKEVLLSMLSLDTSTTKKPLLTFWSSNTGVDWKLHANDKKEILFLATIAADAEPGVHFFRVFNEFGASKLQRFVVGTIPEVIEHEPNDIPDESQTIYLQAAENTAQIINAVLQKRGDVDHYRIHVPRGKTLVASLDSQRSLASPLDATLQIVNRRGIVLAQNLDTHGLDPQIIWTSNSEEDLFVRVFGFPATPNSTIDLAGGDDYVYRLTLTSGPFIEAAMPTVISVSAPTQIELFGYNLPVASIRRTVTNDTTKHVVRYAETNMAGLIEFPVCSLNQFTEPTDAMSTEASVELPACISGRIREKRERDIYRFSGSKGSSLRFRVDSRSLGYPLDAILTVEDSEGKELQRQDDTGKDADPTLVWKVPADGEYRLTVGDINEFGGDLYVYRLWMESAEPEFDLKLESTEFSGVVGEVLEIPVKIDRQGGFDQEIVCLVSGLPATVKCEPQSSVEKNDSAKSIKLKFTASAPWTGPIRITGNVEAHPGTEKAAKTGMENVEEVWLTFSVTKPSS